MMRKLILIIPGTVEKCRASQRTLRTPVVWPAVFSFRPCSISSPTFSCQMLRSVGRSVQCSARESISELFALKTKSALFETNANKRARGVEHKSRRGSSLWQPIAMVKMATSSSSYPRPHAYESATWRHRYCVGSVKLLVHRVRAQGLARTTVRKTSCSSVSNVGRTARSSLNGVRNANGRACARFGGNDLVLRVWL